MNALSINPETKEIKELDITMQANTTYTFFNSILIDELAALKEHIIYVDTDAINKSKTAFLLADELIVGNALILGREDFNDVDVKIKKEELGAAVSFELNSFYTQSLELLFASDVSIYKNFKVSKNSDTLELNTQWVLYTFNIADSKTQEYFLEKLKETLANKEDVFAYMQKMAQLALNAS